MALTFDFKPVFSLILFNLNFTVTFWRELRTQGTLNRCARVPHLSWWRVTLVSQRSEVPISLNSDSFQVKSQLLPSAFAMR